MSVKKLTKTALFTAVAIIAGLIENALPPIFSFAPGVKLGLGNAVVLFALIVLGADCAGMVLVVKILLVALFSGNPASLIYSLPSGAVSYVVSVIMAYFALSRVSVITISCVSATAFNLTQLTIASVIARTNLTAVLPLILIAGYLAGYGTGAVTALLIKKLPRKFLGMKE